MLSRTDWRALPESVRAAVQVHTGPVLRSETVSEGLNSALAATLRTINGTFFAKGLRSDHRGVVTQEREAAINPYVRELSPRILCHVEADGWNVLAFECISGRHADYSPGSADLPLVLDTMRRLGETPCPDLPSMKLAPQRWAAYYDDDPSALAFLDGNTLLHTDWNPFNVLIGDGTAHLIDWAWPTRGAAWIDPACLVVRLIAAGHTPGDAENVAQRTPAWEAACPHAIDTFSAALARMWTTIAQHDPADWKEHIAAGTRAWAAYRSCRTCAQ